MVSEPSETGWLLLISSFPYTYIYKKVFFWSQENWQSLWLSCAVLFTFGSQCYEKHTPLWFSNKDVHSLAPAYISPCHLQKNQWVLLPPTRGLPLTSAQRWCWLWHLCLLPLGLELDLWCCIYSDSTLSECAASCIAISQLWSHPEALEHQVQLMIPL